MRLLILGLVMISGAYSAPRVVPQPAATDLRAGRLLVEPGFRVGLEGACAAQMRGAAGRFAGQLARRTGMPLAQEAAQGSGTLVLSCKEASPSYPVLREDESYRLEVSNSGARLEAPRSIGLLRGLETFLQLVEVTPEGFAAPAVVVRDSPRFPWRGISLDVARHFMPVENVKRTLDAMAAVKMNVLHWHLTDDQGFRVESRKHPELQRMGSDGQFYTQEQIRDVVAYAAERGIRTIPEFDMPGHTTAWFVSHPELASAPGPYSIERGIGIFDPAMDPTKEGTYRLLDEFLGEMAALFPDPYLHIGGDEVNGKQWNKNASIQEFIRSKGLKDNLGLHTYFNQRLLQILTRHGKTAAGWDEVLQPGVPKSVLIQSWRGRTALAEAARQGHPVLLSNGYYLDLMQPASLHYESDPMDGEASALPAEAKALVLGGEACMWTEFVSPENLDNRLWPRAAAVAERLWSPADVRDAASLYRRLEALSLDLELRGLTHRSSERLMLKRLAGSEEIGALATLAEAVESVKDYTRGSLSRHLTTLPLNRLIDAVPPESDAARRFGDEVRLALGSGQDAAAARKAVRAALVRWRDNQTQVEPVLKRSAPLQEVVPVSQGVTTVATAGLEALGAMESGKGLSEERRKALLASVDRANAAPRPAALLIVIAPHVRALIAGKVQK